MNKTGLTLKSSFRIGPGRAIDLLMEDCKFCMCNVTGTDTVTLYRNSVSVLFVFLNYFSMLRFSVVFFNASFLLFSIIAIFSQVFPKLDNLIRVSVTIGT